ncbi:hypothetical protein ACOME3_007727 [Neoechinorhynchus agilis]
MYSAEIHFHLEQYIADVMVDQARLFDQQILAIEARKVDEMRKVKIAGLEKEVADLVKCLNSQEIESGYIQEKCLQSDKEFRLAKEETNVLLTEIESIQSENDQLDAELKEMTSEYIDLVSQIKDVTFHLKAHESVKNLDVNDEELQNASIETRQPPLNAESKTHRRRRNRR